MPFTHHNLFISSEEIQHAAKPYCHRETCVMLSLILNFFESYKYTTKNPLVQYVSIINAIHSPKFIHLFKGNAACSKIVLAHRSLCNIIFIFLCCIILIHIQIMQWFALSISFKEVLTDNGIHTPYLIHLFRKKSMWSKISLP